MPDVLIDPEAVHVLEAGLIGGHPFQLWPDRAPDGPPCGAELPGQTGDGGVLPAQLADRPSHGAGGDRPSFGHQLRDLLDEHPARALRLWAPPGTLPPPQPHRDGTGHIMQPPDPAAAARGEDSAVWAAHQLPRRGDGHGQQ